MMAKTGEAGMPAKSGQPINSSSISGALAWTCAAWEQQARRSLPTTDLGIRPVAARRVQLRPQLLKRRLERLQLLGRAGLQQLGHLLKLTIGVCLLGLCLQGNGPA